MKAVRLTAWGEPAQVVPVRLPEPQGAELLIEVRAAGLCRSDLHVMDAPAGVFDYPLPLTLGHEVAGTVVDAGPGADSSWIGESVVIHGVWSCGACRNCRRGRENYCHDLRRRADGRLPAIGNGLGYDGGLAEAMIVPSERFVVRTRGLAPESAAPLADAALTAYHAIRTNRDLVDGHSVAVVVASGDWDTSPSRFFVPSAQAPCSPSIRARNRARSRCGWEPTRHSRTSPGSLSRSTLMWSSISWVHRPPRRRLQSCSVPVPAWSPWAAGEAG